MDGAPVWDDAHEERDRRIEAPAPRQVQPPPGSAAALEPAQWRAATLEKLCGEHQSPYWCFAGAVVVRTLLLIEIAARPSSKSANRQSWYQTWATRIADGAWWPTGTFYQSPLYAYFLAALYSIFGVGSWSPRVVQIVLGSLNPVFVYAIGTRLFTRRVGWIAGVAFALYGPLVLEEITFSNYTARDDVAEGFAVYLWKAPSGERRAGCSPACCSA